MEQVDEITTSTATSTNGAAYTSQAAQVRSPVNNGLEEVEETNDRDLPPLTGKKRVFALDASVEAGCNLYSSGNPSTGILYQLIFHICLEHANSINTDFYV